MNTKQRISFSIYLLISIASLLVGLIYLFYPTILPYHEQAIGMKWEGLSPSIQMLFKRFMELSGTGMLSTWLLIIIITLIPYKQGHAWARWTIPLVIILWYSIVVYITLNIHLKTGAITPWLPAILSLMITIFAFFLSFSGKGNK